MRMLIIRLFLYVCVNLFVCVICSVPKEKLCADPTCTEPISLAKGSVVYNAPDRHGVSFARGKEIKVVSKSKNKKDYWGVIVDGKRGFVPSGLIQELKIYRALDELIVVPGDENHPFKINGEQNLLKPSQPSSGSLGVEGGSEPKVENTSKVPKEILGNASHNKNLAGSSLKDGLDVNNSLPTGTFEVIEGTTVYLDGPPEVKPSTVNVQRDTQTVLPVSTSARLEEKEKQTESNRVGIPRNVIEQIGIGQSLGNEIDGNDESVKVEGEDEIEEEEEDDEDDEEEEDDEDVGEDDDFAREENNYLKKETNDFKLQNIQTTENAKVTEKEMPKEDKASGTEKLPSEKATDSTEAHFLKETESVEKEKKVESWKILNNFKEPMPVMVQNEVPVQNVETSATILNDLNTTPPTLQTGEAKSSNELRGDVNQVHTLKLNVETTGKEIQNSVGVKADNIKEQFHHPSGGGLYPPLPSQGTLMGKGIEGKTGSVIDTPPQFQGNIAGMDKEVNPAFLQDGKNLLTPKTVTEGPLKIVSEGLNNIEEIVLHTVTEKNTVEVMGFGLTSAPETQGDILDTEKGGMMDYSLNQVPQTQEMVAETNTAKVITQSLYQPPQPQESILEAVTQPNLEGIAGGSSNSAPQPNGKNLEAVIEANSAVVNTDSNLAPQFQVNNPELVAEANLAGTLNTDSNSKPHFQVNTPETFTEEYSETTINDAPSHESKKTVDTITEASTLEMTNDMWQASPQGQENEVTETVTEGQTLAWGLPEGKAEKVDEDSVNAERQTGTEEAHTEGFFSQLMGAFSGWFGTKIGREVAEEVDKVSITNDENENFEKIKMNDYFHDKEKNAEICGDGICKDSTTAVETASSWIFLSPSGLGMDGLVTSTNTFLYLIVTAVTVLLFTLGHNYIEKKGKTGPLIGKINKLEQELLVTSKECLLLKDEIQSARDKIALYESSSNDELVLSLQAELEEAKRVKLELENSIEVLQQELDAATEAGLDLNKMLSEVLTQKGGSESLLKSVENLQAQLDAQQKVIDEMTKKLGVKNDENEALQTALELANERVETLEEELNDMKYNLNIHLKEKEDLTQDLRSQVDQLQTRINQVNESKEIEAKKMENAAEEVRKKLKETTEALMVKEEELKALKDSIRQIKTKGNAKLEVLFDVCHVKAELAKAEKEGQALQTKLEKEESIKKDLEEKVNSLDSEVQKLKQSYEEAAKEKEEAEKKLEVLSTYFKEKETQLQKELGLQEAMWAQKKGDEKAVYNMMKSLQEEVESYKSQNETLKKEILDQERGLKNQIATLEQKAHENWVAARQAERKLEENRQETAQLRNRLTLIEKNVANDVEGKPNHRAPEDINGVEAASPILHDASSPLLFPPPLPLDPNPSLLPPGFMPHPMFMPPPMGAFMPPPPILMGDRRPPPLGRMSSPPLNNQFSPPPPPDFSFERMSSPPLSSPSRNYRSPTEGDRERERFRRRTPPYPPLHPRNWDDGSEMPGFVPISSQKDSRREHKGSNVSSGHSSSDSLDKSSRHSGRV